LKTRMNLAVTGCPAKEEPMKDEHFNDVERTYGGRTEVFCRGLYGRVRTYDFLSSCPINSQEMIMPCESKLHEFYCRRCRKMVKGYGPRVLSVIMKHYQEKHPIVFKRMTEHLPPKK
jgi:hypothetical protein